MIMHDVTESALFAQSVIRPCSAVIAFASSNPRRKHVEPTLNLGAPLHKALDKELLQSIRMEARIRFDSRK